MPKVLRRQRELQVTMPLRAARAPLVANSWDAKKRSFTAVIATERPVLRRYYEILDNEPFDEVLGLEDGEANLERFSLGRAPICDVHFNPQNKNQHGIAIAGSLRFEMVDGFRAALVDFKMLTPEGNPEAFLETERLVAGIAQGIFTSGSIHYKLARLRDVTEPNATRRRMRAIAWEGEHFVILPVGADVGSQVRESGSSFPCTVLTGEAMDEEEVDETESTDTETPAEGGRAAADGGGAGKGPKKTTAPAASAVAVEEEDDDVETSATGGRAAGEEISVASQVTAALVAEDTRRDGILEAARSAGFLDPTNPSEHDATINKWLRKRTVTVESARSRLLNMVVDRDDEQGEVRGRGSRISVGREGSLAGVVVGIRDAMLARIDYQGEHDRHGVLIEPFKPSKQIAEYEHLDMIEMGRALLIANGQIEARRMGRVQLAEEMIRYKSPARLAEGGRESGFHATSDFPSITADVSNKSLRAAYKTNNRTFLRLVRNKPVDNFKNIHSVQLGEFPSLDEVPEGGTYTATTTAEDGTVYKIRKFGKVLRLTYEALLNDDQSAFDRLPQQMGNAAGREESDQFWVIITGNQAMSDGFTLFDGTNHFNVLAGTNAITIANLNTVMALISNQKGPDGQFLSIEGTILAVPPSLRAVALQHVAMTTPTQAGEVNPFKDILELPIIEPRLTAASATSWWLFAPPSEIDGFEVARLRGREGPTVQSRESWNTDGVEWKVSHVFGMAATEWRGAAKGSA